MCCAIDIPKTEFLSGTKEYSTGQNNSIPKTSTFRFAVLNSILEIDGGAGFKLPRSKLAVPHCVIINCVINNWQYRTVR